MMIDSKRKRVIFEICMIILWAVAAVAYGMSGNFLLTLVSLVVVVALILRVNKSMKE